MQYLTFFNKDTEEGRKAQLKYSVGQGIGLYSSWALLAYTHHVLIRYCANKAGVQNYTSYLVLGDDVVIAGKDVADIYVKVITDLGVEISLTKSILPGEVRNGCEFASRLVLPGVDLSPFPVGLISKSDLISRLRLVVNIIDRMVDNRSNELSTVRTSRYRVAGLSGLQSPDFPITPLLYKLLTPYRVSKKTHTIRVDAFFLYSILRFHLLYGRTEEIWFGTQGEALLKVRSTDDIVPEIQDYYRANARILELLVDALTRRMSQKMASMTRKIYG